MTCLQGRLNAGDTTSVDLRCRHPNTWNHGVTVKIGFETIGERGTVSAKSVTHHKNLATEVIAHAAIWQTGETVENWVMRVQTGVLRVPWLFVQRALDATPVEVELGELEQHLVGSARFRHLDQDGYWRLLSHDQAKVLRLRCKRGVCELLAQTALIVWEEDAALTDQRFANAETQPKLIRTERPCLAPVYMERASASNEYAAYTDVLKPLDVERLKILTRTVKWVVLSNIGDYASSNVRMKAFMEMQAHEHNTTGNTFGKLLLLDIGCMGHVAIGIVVKTFLLEKLIPKCYNLGFTFRAPQRYNRLVTCLRLQIERDLICGGYVRVTELNLEWLQHTRMLLSLTMLRPLRTRGRDTATSSAKQARPRYWHPPQS